MKRTAGLTSTTYRIGEKPEQAQQVKNGEHAPLWPLSWEELVSHACESSVTGQLSPAHDGVYVSTVTSIDNIAQTNFIGSS